MAGVLPGVKVARRRRVHQSSGSSSLGIGSSPFLSLRPSFSLFSPTFSASYMPQERSMTYQDNEKLGQLAREARERLDEKLKTHKKSLFTRNNNSDISHKERTNGRSIVNVKREMRREVFGGTKKKGEAKRLMGWAKLRWKSGEQEECAVCLDEFKEGENLANLPCAHKFHTRCLVPWLQTDAHCPCCRTYISS